MTNPVSITSIGSISAVGSDPTEIWKNYLNHDHLLKKETSDSKAFWAGCLPQALKEEVVELGRTFKQVDESVLFAVLATRLAIDRAGWKSQRDIGVNIGSSRGATKLFEAYHEKFIRTGEVGALASPNTTLGNISSWVAQDLKSSGPDISHSVTCSTSLHAVLNAVAWIGSGMAKKFVAGGSEAAVSPFTLAQMRAMKIIASGSATDYPSRALDLEKKKNSMVLGEGAAVVCLEAGKKAGAQAYIEGVGFATEKLKHPVSISASGDALQRAMKMAMGDLPSEEIDAVVMHAPGTIKGDLSEMEAIKAVFNSQLPALTSNKWKIGHTFGASGSLSLELAVLMLQHQEFIGVPYLSTSVLPKKLERILVNAVGFGGNAVSILVSRSFKVV